MPSQSVIRMQGMPQILTIFGLTISSLSILMPASPAWALHGGSDTFGAGLATTVLMVVTVLTQFLVPKLTGSFGWKPVLLAGSLFMGLPSIAQALSPSLTNILVTSGLRGIGFGILTVCCASALSYLVPAQYRGRAVGLYGLSAAGSQLIFTPLAPALLAWWGFRPVLVLGAIASLAAPFAWQLGAMVDRYLATQSQADTDAGADSGTLSVLGRIWPALLSLTLITSAGGALLTFSTELAATPWLATLALFIFTLAAAPTRLYGGSLTDRYGTRLLMTPTLAIGALGSALLALVLSALTVTSTAGVVVFLVAVTLVGAAYGFLQSVTMVRALNDAGGTLATQKASVAWNAHFDIGTGLGALAIGALAQGFTFGTAWWVSAAVLGVVALLLGAKDTRQSRRTSA
ncbi:MAG: MFS transporter [Rothia sp. (in: high G+C Gram-positive bacteria)]|nr:MFS transporter [Rothia sp. (in: high G+C Gram-positive bacteria)]